MNSRLIAILGPVSAVKGWWVKPMTSGPTKSKLKPDRSRLWG